MAKKQNKNEAKRKKKLFTKSSSFKIIEFSDGEYPDLAYDGAAKDELKEYDIIRANDEEDVIDIIMDNPQVDAIVTYSTEESTVYNVLCEKLSMEYKRKWYHFKDYEKHGRELGTYLAFHQFDNFDAPFFSITTPLYKTNKEYFIHAYNSLKAQVFPDWEWVLVDDSPLQLTWVQKFIKDTKDLRLKYYRIEPVTNGCIGLAKWRTNCLSRGKWLLEFDHDDMLPFWSLYEAKEAIEKYPDAGFVYSDDAPITGDNFFRNYTYGDEYGLGYAFPYKSDSPSGQEIVTNRSPDINSATIRHICGAPNHFRCWRRDVYFKVGGHNPRIRIADDFELVVRTFLETRFIHVIAPCYLQRFDGTNSQYTGTNIRDIQRRVRWTSAFYNEKVHGKIKEYGYDEENYLPDNAYETMVKHYGKKDLKYFNYIYRPEWEKYPLFQTAKENMAYVKEKDGKKEEEKEEKKDGQE